MKTQPGVQVARNTHFWKPVGREAGAVHAPTGSSRADSVLWGGTCMVLTDVVGGHMDKVLLNSTQRSSLTRPLESIVITSTHYLI